MVALSDALTGIDGTLFAGILGIVAQMQSVLIPPAILAALNAISVWLALNLVDKEAAIFSQT